MKKAYLGLLVIVLVLLLISCEKPKEGLSDEELFGSDSGSLTGAAQVMDLSRYGLPAYYSISDLCLSTGITSCSESSGEVSFSTAYLGSGIRNDLCLDTVALYNYRCKTVGAAKYLELCIVICKDGLNCVDGGCR